MLPNGLRDLMLASLSHRGDPESLDQLLIYRDDLALSAAWPIALGRLILLSSIDFAPALRRSGIAALARDSDSIRTPGVHALAGR
jgi:hypothetical protein